MPSADLDPVGSESEALRKILLCDEHRSAHLEQSEATVVVVAVVHGVRQGIQICLEFWRNRSLRREVLSLCEECPDVRGKGCSFFDHETNGCTHLSEE